MVGIDTKSHVSLLSAIMNFKETTPPLAPKQTTIQLVLCSPHLDDFVVAGDGPGLCGMPEIRIPQHNKSYM